MGVIIDPNALAQPAQSQLPTVAQITENYGSLLASLMMLFRKNGIDGFYIHGVGQLLSQLTFDAKNKQSAADIQIMATKIATEHLEQLKLHLLRESIPASQTIN